ncbi:DUF6642 family protein [uncultured Winogradskyella sp.]|uniref:DUF6642 family protein n=1 Tax=uncultured Winogradskyella sp. TaxID=395353 RepID=UPI0035191935
MKVGRNIFALEGEWDNRLDSKDTVKSALTFLNQIYDIDIIFRKVNTEEGLIGYLKEACRPSYKKYGIILLAFHGTKQGLELFKNNSIELLALAEYCKGLFNDKIIHFSSCSTAGDTERFKEFKAITEAKAVMGYSKNVSFLESTLFDIALLQKLNEFSRPGDVNNYMKREFNSLCNTLGFKMI